MGKVGKAGKVARSLDDVSEVSQAARAARVAEGLPEGAAGLERVQPSLLAREGGLFEAELPGVRVQELAGELAARQIDSPLGLAALDPREIGDALREVPEFRNFLRLYREGVSLNRQASSFEGTGRPLELIEFARRSGVGPPGRVGRGPEMSLDAALVRLSGGKRVSRGELGPAALNLGTRLRNSSVFLTEDIYTPSFYVEFNRILKAVEGRTGMPVLPLSTGLAAASSKAAPYDELRRLRRVAPFMEYRNGQAYFPTEAEIFAFGRGNHPLYPRFAADGSLGSVDGMAVQSGRGWADAINNPNLFEKDVFGLAAKTMPYAYLRYDPAYGLAYVSDTVDGLGQFLIGAKAGKSDTAKATSAIQNQFAGRMLAEVYGVPASNVQEAIWAYIRVARDGFSAPKKGGWSSKAIAPAFRGSDGSAEDVLVETVQALDPQIVRLAQDNHSRFVSRAKSGDEIGWDWDSARNQPVIANEQFLIKPTQRLTKKTQQETVAPALQAAMLEAVEAAGPVLRQRLLALAAASGLSLSALVQALGESGSDIPVGVLDA